MLAGAMTLKITTCATETLELLNSTFLNLTGHASMQFTGGRARDTPMAAGVTREREWVRGNHYRLEETATLLDDDFKVSHASLESREDTSSTPFVDYLNMFSENHMMPYRRAFSCHSACTLTA